MGEKVLANTESFDESKQSLDEVIKSIEILKEEIEGALEELGPEWKGKTGQLFSAENRKLLGNLTEAIEGIEYLQSVILGTADALSNLDTDGATKIGNR